MKSSRPTNLSVSISVHQWLKTKSQQGGVANSDFLRTSIAYSIIAVPLSFFVIYFFCVFAYTARDYFSGSALSVSYFHGFGVAFRARKILYFSFASHALQLWESRSSLHEKFSEYAPR